MQHASRITIPASRFIALVLSAALTAGAASCVEHKNRALLLRNLATEKVSLQSPHTGIPEIELTVPKGFVATRIAEARYDSFVIYDPADTDVVQRGMIAINVTPSPSSYFPDSASFERSRGTLPSGEDVKWRETFMIDDAGVKVYQREMELGDLLKFHSSPDKEGQLVLQAFVVGTDVKRVEQLMGSVETMVLTPKSEL